MKKLGQKVLGLALGGAMLLSSLPMAAVGAAETAGTPYGEGGYDASVPHVVVNQVFGASDDAEVVSHSFIELYNQADAAVSLDGWYLWYRSSEDGGDESWQSFALSGDIAANGHYLVRCGAVDELANGAWMVPAGDAEWNVQLHNKGVAVALLSEDTDLNAENFAGAVTDENRPAGYVDLLAVQGNDEEAAQIPPAYEGSYEGVQSKKKAVCRQNFADTDDNAADAEDLDYSDLTPADVPVQNARGRPSPRRRRSSRTSSKMTASFRTPRSGSKRRAASRWAPPTRTAASPRSSPTTRPTAARTSSTGRSRF